MKPIPRICHIVTGLNVGGAERALTNILLGGLGNSANSTVVSLLDEGHYGPILKEGGVNVYSLKLRRKARDISIFPKLADIIRSINPDIIQGWMYHGNIVATVSQQILSRKSKLVWNVRAALDAYDEMPVGTRMAIQSCRFLSKAPSSVIYNSARSRTHHEKLGFPKEFGMVIPNGFDTSFWKGGADKRVAARLRLGLPKEALVVGFVARNDPLKHPSNFLNAFALCVDQIPTARAVMIGRDLDSAVRGMAIHDKIILLGERNDVQDIIPGFDMLCLSSKLEGFPNVIGEAMACGIPCLTTDVGDAAEIVGSTGWVVPPQNSEALARAMIDALRQGHLTLFNKGKSARKRIIEKYSLQTIVSQYANLYGNLVDQIR